MIPHRFLTGATRIRPLTHALRHSNNICDTGFRGTGDSLVDYYRGNPEALLAQRRRKLQTARELRKQENIKLRQRLTPWVEDQTVSYSRSAIVSL